MGKKGPKRGRKLLTEAELEIMGILWGLGQGTVAEVLEGHPASPKPAYTTVSTLLRILEQKGVVESQKAGRGHQYLPKIARDEYGRTSVGNLVEKVFGGTPSAVVRSLVSLEGVTPEDLAEIRRILDEKEGGR